MEQVRKRVWIQPSVCAKHCVDIFQHHFSPVTFLLTVESLTRYILQTAEEKTETTQLLQTELRTTTTALLQAECEHANTSTYKIFLKC